LHGIVVAVYSGQLFAALMYTRLRGQTPTKFDQVNVLPPRFRGGKPAGAAGALGDFGVIPLPV
jgi:hypothetical protein